MYVSQCPPSRRRRVPCTIRSRHDVPTNVRHRRHRHVPTADVTDVTDAEVNTVSQQVDRSRCQVGLGSSSPSSGSGRQQSSRRHECRHVRHNDRGPRMYRRPSRRRAATAATARRRRHVPTMNNDRRQWATRPRRHRRPSRRRRHAPATKRPTKRNDHVNVNNNININNNGNKCRLGNELD